MVVKAVFCDIPSCDLLNINILSLNFRQSFWESFKPCQFWTLSQIFEKSTTLILVPVNTFINISTLKIFLAYSFDLHLSPSLLSSPYTFLDFSFFISNILFPSSSTNCFSLGQNFLVRFATATERTKIINKDLILFFRNYWSSCSTTRTATGTKLLLAVSGLSNGGFRWLWCARQNCEQ